MEETFCDAIGMSMFGKSFAFAFHYLLAPSFGGGRAPHYPKLTTRASFMTAYGAVDFAAIGYPRFDAEFEAGLSSWSAKQDFIVTAADSITNSEAKMLYEEAAQIISARSPSLAPDPSKEATILEMFELGVPAKSPGSLTNILNAGWEYVRNKGASSPLKDRHLFEWISELVFKTIEVLEYERRVNA